MADIKSLINKLALSTQLEATPESFFESALASATSYHNRINVLISYGRYLLENGKNDAAYTALEEAKQMAQENQLKNKLSQIEALLVGQPDTAAAYPIQAELEHETPATQTINGRYLLHEEIGRGGMGVVYRATDRLTGDIVALKQINVTLKGAAISTSSEFTPEAVQLAFAQEFQILASLRHPHIISVLDYGFDTQSEPFFTMDYLQEAMSVQEAAAKLDLDAKCGFIIQSLQALTYLHRHGVLHRDIKPSNILVNNGRVHLADFGLSATEQQHSQLSGGTLLYMAPEVYRDHQTYDFRSDLYSLGMIMYQLFAGYHPFDRLSPDSDQAPLDVEFPLIL